MPGLHIDRTAAVIARLALCESCAADTTNSQPTSPLIAGNAAFGREALRLAERGAWNESEQLHRRLLEAHEHESATHYGLGVIALARHDSTAATRCFRQSAA